MKRLALLCAVVLCACDGPRETEPQVDVAVLDGQLRALMASRYGGGVMPIGAMPAQDPALVALGKALFFDPILSGNRDVSCASCHDVGSTMIDGQSLAVGTGGIGASPHRTPGVGRQFVSRNAPTLINIGLGVNYILWDGRVQAWGPSNQVSSSAVLGLTLPTGLTHILAAQALLPVLNRVEMRGMPGDTDIFGAANELAVAADSTNGVWTALATRLKGIPAYATLFSAAYPSTPPSSITFQHAANAIAAFELNSFTRHDSRFDRYLARDDRALTVDEKLGGLVFFGNGRCAECHTGPLMGGSQLANIGTPQVGPGSSKSAPLDRGQGDWNAGTWAQFVFRVPPLRNVELTAPYMHNGAYPTLEAVVRHYTNADSAQKHYDVNQLPAELRGTHHGDATTLSLVGQTLDFRLKQGIKLTDKERANLVAFLKTLTDPAAVNLSAIKPTSVPSGLPMK